MNPRASDKAVSLLGTIPFVDMPGSIGGFNMVGYGKAFRSMQVNLITAIEGTPGAETLTMKIQDSPPPALTAFNNPYNGTDDGGSKLLAVTGRLNAIGIPFTVTDALTIWRAEVMLSQVGAIAAGKSVWCEIYEDNAGDPDAAPYYGAACGKSLLMPAASVAASATLYNFTFPWGQDLAAGDYWLVVIGDWTASDVNYLKVHYNTVVGTSSDKVLDNGAGPAWAASANTAHWFRMWYLDYSDVALTKIEGGAFTAITGNDPALNIVDEYQLREVDLRQCNDTVRCKFTITAGTDWQALVDCVFLGAKLEPVLGAL